MARNDRGIALVLMTGLVALVALLALAIGQGGRLAAAGSSARLAQAEAALTAESGLHYAAARLWEDPRSTIERGLSVSPENTCDDWTSRGSEPGNTPVPLLNNPSFNRGDRWTDRFPEAEGSFEPGDFLKADLDKNGRFDGVSGRLRGGPGNGTYFSLRVRSQAGLINVNSGTTLGLNPLGDFDLNGVLNQDQTFPPLDPDWNGNGIPDWRDAAHADNLHLINTLGNLGVICGCSDVYAYPTVVYAPRPFDGYDEEDEDWDWSNRGDDDRSKWPINKSLPDYRFSTLGFKIVANRPPGGYRSIEDLKPVLKDDYSRVVPFLSTTGDLISLPYLEGPMDAVTFARVPPESIFQSQSRISLPYAPTEVLQACLRYLSASGTDSKDAEVDDNASDRVVVETHFVRLLPEEADDIAAALVSARQSGGIGTWRRLLEILHRPPIPIRWQDDPYTIDMLEDTSLFIHQKQDLVLALMNANWNSLDLFSWHRNSLDVLRDDVEGYDATRAIHVHKFNITTNNIFTSPFARDGTSSGFYDTLPPKSTMAFSLGGIGSSTSFRVEASGWSVKTPGEVTRAARSARADLSTPFDTSLILTSQQDFEQLPDYASRPPRTLHRYPGGEIYCDDPSGPARNGMQSHPRLSVRSFSPPPGNYLLNYSKILGDLRLAAHPLLQMDLPAPAYGLSFDEDLDAKVENNIGDPRGPRQGSVGTLGWTVFEKSNILTPTGLGLVNGFETDLGKDSIFLIASWIDRPPFFPLSRHDIIDEDGNPVPGGGAIKNGTITFWVPSHNGEEYIVPGYITYRKPDDEPARAFVKGGFRLNYWIKHQGGGGDPPPPPPPPPPPDGGGGGIGGGGGSGRSDDGTGGGQTYAPKEYFSVWFCPTRPDDPGRVIFRASPAPSSEQTFEFFLPDSFATRQACGHLITLTFTEDPDPLTTTVTIHLDEENLGTATWKISSLFAPAKSYMDLVITGFPIDDLFLYKDTLPAETIKKKLEEGRYFGSGTYRSPLFTFDPDRLPDGAKLAGAAWDAFFPEITPQGVIEFRILPYADVAGLSPLPEIGPFSYTAGQFKAGQVQSFPFLSSQMRQCRSFRFHVTMQANTLSAPQDTPVLDEFRLYYRKREFLLMSNLSTD